MMAEGLWQPINLFLKDHLILRMLSQDSQKGTVGHCSVKCVSQGREQEPAREGPLLRTPEVKFLKAFPGALQNIPTADRKPLFSLSCWGTPSSSY